MYYLWGEVRYTTPEKTLPTRFTFTGQYSYMADTATDLGNAGFGLMFYNARWYDPSLGRFAQADTIVPSGVQGLDRYAYVNNNPVMYTDPSGHRPCDDEFDCSRRPFKNKIDYKNNTCTQECRRDALFSQYKFLLESIRNDSITDLEALARLTDYGAGLAGDCTSCFMNDLGAILTGHSGDDGRTAAYREILVQANMPGAIYHPYYEEISGKDEFMQSGYDPAFQDPAYETTGTGGNQAHHYWFFVQFAYESGFLPALASNLAHETIVANSPAGMSYNDYALGTEGALVGKAVQLGIIKPSEVGDIIRTTLSPGSYSSMIWTYP